MKGRRESQEELRSGYNLYPKVELSDELSFEMLYQKELEEKEIVELDDEELHLPYLFETTKGEIAKVPSSDGSLFTRSFENLVCMQDAYFNGNLDTLEKICEEQGDRGGVKELLLKRNEVMSESIDSYIKKQSGKLFAVVGCLHILGEGSILELLKNKGYTIKRVEQQEVG